jgi:hypothetical protein
MQSNAIISFQREVPVRHNVDVFVAGGGPAGCAAAVMAARQGASVFLAEGHSCFGGMGTAGLVPAFMQFGDGVNFLSAGFGEELLERLIAAGGTYAPAIDEKTGVAGDRTGCYPILAEVLKRVYDDIVQESGVKFSFHTNLIDVEVENGNVKTAVLWGKSGIFGVKAKVFIDCTGDGDLAAWAGASFEKGDAEGGMMPGTLCSTWIDVFDSIDVNKYHYSQNAFIEQAHKDGVLTYCDKHLPGMFYLANGIGGGNIGHTFGVDNTDERSVTQALVWGRKLLTEYERYYKEYLTGFEKMRLVASGSLLGVRETRRIMGDYMLCLDDFKNRSEFDDEIGRYCYPVDIHVSRPDDEAEYQRFFKEFSEMRYQKGESYGVPYRTLTPRGLSNVLVAGRCISTDRFLQGSIRVMPGCYITGQAAGIAAAMAANTGNDIHNVNVPELQHKLVKAGALLPNFKQ